MKTITDDKKTVAAVILVYRGTRCFVCTYGTATAGYSIPLERWRSIARRAELVISEMNIPKVCEKYYRNLWSGRQVKPLSSGWPKSGKEIIGQGGSMPVKTKLLATCFVDPGTLYRGGRWYRRSISPNNNFLYKIGEGCIENNADEVRTRGLQTSDDERP